MTAPALPPGMTAEEADAKLTELDKQAEAHKVEWMQRQVPSDLQPYFEWWMQQQPSTELPADSTIISNDDSIRVVLDGGGDVPGSPGRAAVLNGHLDFVQLAAVQRRHG